MPDIVTSQVFSDGEKGITATKINNIIANSVIQPDFVTAKPSSATLDPTDQLLEVKGAGTYARITGSQLISSVSAQVDVTPQIYSVRLRSFNAIGNPTFEVDQRMTGGTMSANGSIFVMDRWLGYNNTGVSPSCSIATGQPIKLPGTNFRISQGLLNFSTLSVSKPTLAAGDQLLVYQTVEGAQMRELIDDVHSISILALTNVVGGLKFAVSLRDSGNTRSLVKLCTIPQSVMTLIQLPNIPIWASGGGWTVAPGAAGYTLTICMAAGSSMITPANDTFQTGNFVGAIGMDNILSKPANSSLQIAFIQHEPGAVCTTPIDCPFGQNLDGDMGCLRYYQKSYNHSTALGTVTQLGVVDGISAGAWVIPSGGRFSKPMAKLPAIGTYDPNNGAANSMFNNSKATHVTVSSFAGTSEKYIGAINVSTAQQVGDWLSVHYTADTGW